MARQKDDGNGGINRRELLRQAGQAALVPLTLAAACEAEAVNPTRLPGPRRLPVYRLRPCRPDEAPGHECSCNACENHAAHKFFATPQAADANRAHLHCDCRVVLGQRVSFADYFRMFRPNTPGARLVFDTRWERRGRGR
jgi:hypothetical protein